MIEKLRLFVLAMTALLTVNVIAAETPPLVDAARHQDLSLIHI